MKVKSESEVAQSCLTHSDPTDCSLPGSSAHGIFQARVLEWVAIAFSRKCRLIHNKENQQQISDGLKWEGSSKKLRGKRKFGRMMDKFLAFIVGVLIFACISISIY